MKRILLVLALFGGALTGAGCRSTGSGDSSRPYRVVFEGNAGIATPRLLEMIQLDLNDFDRSDYKKAYIDDAAYDLEVGYQAQGFPFATVQYVIEDDGDLPDTVRFLVNEGPRTVLEATTFAGMQHLAEGNFTKALSSKRTPVLQGSQPYYVEREILAALVAMEGEYVELGYLEARVALTRTELSDDRSTARIFVQVNEGPRFRVGAAIVESEDAPPELLERCRALIEEALTRTERIYQQRTGYELRGQLVETLAGQGYADASVRLTQARQPEAAVIDVTFEITAGPRVRIAKVQFSEGLQTREGFLRSRLQLAEGDVYDSEKVHESVRKLYETGLFKRVAVKVDEGTGEDRTLIVDVEEAPSGEVFVEPGYGSYERARIGLGYRKKNLWGTGRLLRVEGTLAELAQRGAITLTDPWFLGSQLVADLSLRYDRRQLPSFTNEDLGAGIFWTREWSAQHSTGFGYQYRRSRATDIKVVDEDVEAAQQSLNISSVQLSQQMDSRDNFFLPSTGWFNEATLEYGDKVLGSELDFLRTSIRTSTYGRLLPRTVVAGSFRTGVIFPLGRTESIPLQERYFNGGQSSVRSFRFDQLGPKDENGNPLGGETYATANLELRQDLTARFQGAAFIDAGNVTPLYEDYLDFADIQLGIGVGLRYLLAIGPVRLDVGFNPDPGPTDPDYVIHFSIGMAF